MEQETIKILAISGSLRPNSSNAAIINKLALTAPTDVIFIKYNGLAGLPHFNPDLDDDNPAPVIALRQLIKEADGVLICTPEYAFGIPGSLKNALDWTVSSGEFVNKPTALITASSVGTNAHADLLLVLNAISAKLTDNATLLIPFIRTKVNSNGAITDAATITALQQVLNALIQTIRK